MSHAIVCSSCGAKIRAGRERCPRCRATLTRPEPAAIPVDGRRLKRIAGGILAAVTVVLAALWIVRDRQPETTASAIKPIDQPAPKPARQPYNREAVRDDAQQPRPFLDPPGAAAVAYSAGDYDSALAQFQKAIERNPEDAESLSNLGQVLVRLGRTTEALPHFERAIKLIPDRWAYHFNLARALGLTGRWDDAIASYRTAQKLFPNDYATTFNLALALHKKGDEAGAIDEYKKAIELEPNDASFRMALAISYERLQKRAEAADAYQEYLRLSPSAPDADKVRTKIAELTGAPAAFGPLPATASSNQG